jgi:hypothetical protein
MNRFVLLVPVAAGLGALLSRACSFDVRPLPPCTATAGSATVSSPTGVFGPPNFDGVNRDYALQANCAEGSRDHRSHNLSAEAHYNPTTHFAFERIEGEVIDRPFKLDSSWSCDDDPWLVQDVQCTELTWVQQQGSLYGIDPNPTEPLSASLVDVNARRDIAARLLADFIEEMRTHPNTCNTRFGSIAVACAPAVPIAGEITAGGS